MKLVLIFISLQSTVCHCYGTFFSSPNYSSDRPPSSDRYVDKTKRTPLQTSHQRTGPSILFTPNAPDDSNNNHSFPRLYYRRHYCAVTFRTVDRRYFIIQDRCPYCRLTDQSIILYRVTLYNINNIQNSSRSCEPQLKKLKHTINKCK